jgi:hypothetical protein
VESFVNHPTRGQRESIKKALLIAFCHKIITPWQRGEMNKPTAARGSPSIKVPEKGVD